jgi:5-methylcytosine-specific restriction endonuclease McrA
MPRINVYLTEGTYKRLFFYLRKTHGKHRATSLIIQQAINDFLAPFFNCEECGRNFSNDKNGIVLHHKIAIKDGGSDDPYNIQVLCRSCHNKIHDIANIIRAGQD